jgi:serine/threonine-protein kinase HipA
MKKIEVWADWDFLNGPTIVGELIASVSRGKEIFSFEYDETWLGSEWKCQIDPELKLFEGKFHPESTRDNFGVFLDSSPDRWGRMLMLRREGARAREEKRQVKSLMESDFLLGVYDQTRMGGLRFKMEDKFLDDHHDFPAPPWTKLRELEHAASLIETDGESIDSEALKILLAPGSSLGGARPKANVLDPSSELWIAKFPSQNDLKDVGAWEFVTYELARACGVNMAEARLEKFQHRQYRTFLTKRFDRKKDKRVHFASAMTLLQHQDGDDSTKGASYLEFVDFIIQHGAPAKVTESLEQLWRRIVFSIAVSNSDDHLRNHGFLLTKEGWELSPAYDINPNETAQGLSLNISLDDNALDFELALEVAEYFRVSKSKAKEIIDTVRKQIPNWKKLAAESGISRSEQERMATSFESAF